jgi:lambda family phage portal protein
MNWLDGVIGWFSPKRGLARARARHAMRIYEGADVGRRASSWRGVRGSSANTEIMGAIGSLRDRARDLCRNTPHAPRMLDVLTAGIVGDGIRPVPNTGSDRLNDRVEALWNEWQGQADVQGLMSFYSMQVLAVRSLVESGEIVMRFLDRKQSDVQSAVPLQLQLLESDLIDSSRDGIYEATKGGERVRSRLGVGLGEFDKRIGLWLHPYHPGEMIGWAAPLVAGYTSKFVQMDELIHLFIQCRPGQVRGVSWFAPMMTTARDFTDFMDAVTVKARVEACFSAFVTQADELEAVLQDNSADYGQPAGSDPFINTLEPGTMKLLKPGQDIKFAQPTTTTQVETIAMFDLMAMAAALGVTYDQLSGDLRGANYSSLRAGKLEFRSRVTQIQKLVIIPRLCERVWNRFIDRAILAGALNDRKAGYPCDWVTPAFPSVNPKFDEDAEERSVRAGRATPQTYIASWGNNWRKQLRNISEFYQYADELGVSLDIDVRKYTRAGSAQPVPKQPGAPGAPDGGLQANGHANGAANGAGGVEPQPVMLVDVNGDPIDLDDLMADGGSRTEEMVEHIRTMLDNAQLAPVQQPVERRIVNGSESPPVSDEPGSKH